MQSAVSPSLAARGIQNGKNLLPEWKATGRPGGISPCQKGLAPPGLAPKLVILMPSGIALRAGPKRAVSNSPLDLSSLPAKRDYRRVEAFLNQFLSIPKGENARQPFRILPFQRQILRALFPSSGKRPRQALTSIARGNGKSSLAAAISLYFLYADEVESAQVLCVASDLRQAAIVFDAAVRMVSLNPELAARTKVYQDKLLVPSTNSAMFPLPANEGSLQGYDPSAAIVDELAYVPAEVWESVTGATGKRDQSLVWAISTPPTTDDSVMHALVTMAKTEPRPDFAFMEWTSDPSHKINCLHCCRAANPALGKFLKIDGLRSVQRTMRENSFRRLRLGQFIATAEDAWLTPEQWAACEQVQQIEDGSPVVLAFDGSYSGDATAIVAVSVEVVPHIQPVAIWEPQGREGYRVPISDVEEAVRAACRRWRVLEVSCDPFRWQKSLQMLAAEGLPMAEFGQTRARMTPATQSLSEAVVNQEVTHSGDPELTRHVLNARVTDDHTGVRLHKSDKHSTNKIDTAVCAVMGHSRARFYASKKEQKKGRVVSWKYV